MNNVGIDLSNGIDPNQIKTGRFAAHLIPNGYEFTDTESSQETGDRNYKNSLRFEPSSAESSKNVIV